MQLHAKITPNNSLRHACHKHALFRRRHGHNELDDPSITLPLTYSRIEAHPTVLAVYRDRLRAEGVVTAEEVAQWEAELLERYDRGARHAVWRRL
jgi:2-oxoglutarate dehydrogenase complex dehydrogenase (E1) component-like enzyme